MWRISWSNSIIRWQDYRVAALRLAESNFRHTQASNTRFTQNSLGQSKTPIDSDHGIYRDRTRPLGWRRIRHGRRDLGVWQPKRVWFRHTVLLRLRPLGAADRATQVTASLRNLK